MNRSRTHDRRAQVAFVPTGRRPFGIHLMSNKNDGWERGYILAAIAGVRSEAYGFFQPRLIGSKKVYPRSEVEGLLVSNNSDGPPLPPITPIAIAILRQRRCAYLK